MPDSDDSAPKGFVMVGLPGEPPPPETDAPRDPKLDAISRNVALELEPAAVAVLRRMSKENRIKFAKVVEDLQIEHTAYTMATTPEERERHRSNANHIINRILSIEGCDKVALYNTTVCVLGAIAAAAIKMAVSSFINDVTEGKFGGSFTGRF